MIGERVKSGGKINEPHHHYHANELIQTAIQMSMMNALLNIPRTHLLLAMYFHSAQIQ